MQIVRVATNHTISLLNLMLQQSDGTGRGRSHAGPNSRLAARRNVIRALS